MVADQPFEYLDLEDLLHLAYPDIWTKAAALLTSIVKNHALVDGNKRLGWLATAVFLDLNGVDVARVSNDDVYELVMAVAAGKTEVADLSERLRHMCDPS